MDGWGERLRAARQSKGMTQRQLAELCGWPGQTRISHYEREGREPSAEDWRAMAHVLGTRPEVLQYGSGLGTNASQGPEVRGRVPVISWVQAGNWAGTVDNFSAGHAEEWAETTAPIHRHTYALRVSGDSMTNPTGEEPTFPHGTRIIVEPDLIDGPENLVNRLVIVRANSDAECTFKQLVRDAGRFYLKPINPRYPMLPLPADAAICGVVREKVVRYV